jgi:gamma-D-glutamyl-L-lysine dipeptidyl-peptidase
VDESLTPGRRASVVVGVSTAWTAPDAPRPCDAPAVAGVPRHRDWVGGMSREERRGLGGRTVTQVLFGDTVLIEEVAGGWARVVAVDQPAPGLDPRGYPGWVPSAHIAADDRGEQPEGRRYVVDALLSTLRETPAGTSPVMVDIVLGTRLTALAPPPGPGPQEHWVPVAVPGRAEPLWADAADLAPAPTRPPAAEDVLRVALRFAGAPYLWGGLSPYGIDCSGLVHLAHRRLGAVVPRDAADQADASRPVEPAEAAPGDLCFFRDPGDPEAPIDHVGLVHRPGRLLHASGAAGQVRREPIEGTLARRLSAVHRTLP